MSRKIANFFAYFLCFLLLANFCFSPLKTSAAYGVFSHEEILVKFKKQENFSIFKVPAGISAEDYASAYQKKSGVEYAEPNYAYQATVVPGDTDYKKQWYLEKIRAPYAWDKIRETPNIVIALIDTGVQVRHPDLMPNIWENADEIPGNNKDDDNNGFIDDFNGWDFVQNVPDPAPKFEEGFTEAGVMHGTIVAGIIGAVGSNSSGITGITWKAKIMPLRALDGRGEGKTSEVIRAIDYAIANKADIINFSFVGLSYSRGLFEAIKRAHEAGILLVAAAGNEQSEGEGYDLSETPMYPACDDGEDNMVIGVAATDVFDQKANFSSYGFRCVDIAAPGVSFYSTLVFAPTKKIGERFFDQYFGGFWSGTSMATPVIAGTLALIEGNNILLKGKEAQDILLATADNINRFNPAYLGQLGSGRVNAFAAVNLADRILKEREKKIILSPASDYAGSEQIKEYGADGKLIKSFSANKDNLKNSFSLAGGDIDGNHEEEIITGAGAGQAPEVKIFDKNGGLKKSFFAYDKNFRGGVKVALGDINSDGAEEIITGAGAGLAPVVRIFNNSGVLQSQFFAYDQKFLGGVNVAVGDVNSDGAEEIITGTGYGGGPQVRIFDKNGKVLGQFFAYDKNFRGGVNVALAQISGRAQNDQKKIITSPGKGGGPHVRIFDNKGILQGQFFAYENNFRGGVNVAAGDVNSDGSEEIITGAGPGGSPHVRIFSAEGKMLNSFYGLERGFAGGVNVGVVSIKN